jgi:hypothetical protein
MMQARKISPRSRSFVSARLDMQLAAYVAAAGAAGVGMLATPQDAEGEIVYTPTNVSLFTGNATIDVNNDGTPDFLIFWTRCASHANCLEISPLVTGNGIRGVNVLASAGIYGLPVGPRSPFLSKFVSSGNGSFVGFMAEASEYGTTHINSGGPWADKTNKYLGLRFLINGETHYGWARMTVLIRRFLVVLTGYAYETMPNHRILDGYTTGVDSTSAPTALLAPTARPASLGALARGADGLAIWRRDDEVVAA